MNNIDQNILLEVCLQQALDGIKAAQKASDTLYEQIETLKRDNQILTESYDELSLVHERSKS